MVAGVRQYFDRCLRHFLLYSHEVQQAEEALGAGPAGAATASTAGGGDRDEGLVGGRGPMLFQCWALILAASSWPACDLCISEADNDQAGLHCFTAEAKSGGAGAGEAADQRAGAGGAAQPPRRAPSDLYGAEHLVRLFVKLPELVPVAYMTPPVSRHAAHAVHAMRALSACPAALACSKRPQVPALLPLPGCSSSDRRLPSGAHGPPIGVTNTNDICCPATVPRAPSPPLSPPSF